MEPPRAIFVDLDGTLLNKDHGLSPYTRDVLTRLRRQRPDVKLVIATGRPHPHVIDLFRILDLSPDYLISNNGAVVRRGDTHEVVFQHTLPPGTVRELLQIPLPLGPREGNEAATLQAASAEEDEATQPATTGNASKGEQSGGEGCTRRGGDPAEAVPLVAANVFRADEWVATNHVKGLGSTYRLGFHPRLDANLPCTEHLWQDVYSFFFYGPNEYLLPLEATLQDKFGSAITHVFSLPQIIDISPSGIDKGTAVREVLALLHLTPRDAIAFGDGMNDLPMLEAVGRGYLMANSYPEVFTAAREKEVVGSNEEDGVAKKVEELFALRG